MPLYNLDFNCYSTESSVVFSVGADMQQPYWAEAHVHLGKYNVVHITATITSEMASATQGTEFAEAFLSKVEYQLGSFLGLLNHGVEIEVYLTVFYFGKRVAHAPTLWGKEFGELIGYTKHLLEEKAI